MFVEATDSPVRYRLKDGHEILLTPGEPIDLPDRQARQLLKKAAGKVRVVCPVSPAPQTAPPDSCPEVIGQVVAVESMAGVRTLAVIASVREDHHALPPGRWLGLAANGDARWVRDRLVADWAPTCAICDQSRWWWSPVPVVLCAICTPPVPNWRLGFEELADLTHGILPEDSRLPAILAAVDGCDAAWLAKDWGRFQQHTLQVQAMVMTGGDQK